MPAASANWEGSFQVPVRWPPDGNRCSFLLRHCMSPLPLATRRTSEVTLSLTVFGCSCVGSEFSQLMSNT